MITAQEFYQIKFCSAQLKMSIPQIAEHLELNKGTVRHWMSKETFKKNIYKKRASKLDPFREKIEELLRFYPGFSAPQIYDKIKAKTAGDNGYTGGISILKDFLREIRPKNRKVYLTLNFPQGKVAQVDWGCAGYITIDGRKRKVSYFVMVLGYSRMTFVMFTLSEAQEFWDLCHIKAFEYFGGVPQKVMVDNCKTAVISNKKGYDVVFNERYMELATHYGFEIVACNVRQPQEKGIVEKIVDYTRRNFINGRSLEPFEMLNMDIRDWLDNVANVRIHGTTQKQPVLLHKEENLQPLPIHPHDYQRREKVCADMQYRIRFDANKYSVPAEYAFKELDLVADENMVNLWYKDNCIAKHPRCFGSKNNIFDEAHDKALLEGRKRAEEQKHLAWVCRLTPRAEDFYNILKQRVLNPQKELRKIYALSEIYSKQQIANAIEDTIEMQSCNADYVKLILDSKKRSFCEPGPLHISHKTDDLNIELDPPNMDRYKDK